MGEFYLFRETETNGKYCIKEAERRLLGTEEATEGERGAGGGKKLTHIDKKCSIACQKYHKNKPPMTCR